MDDVKRKLNAVAVLNIPLRDANLLLDAGDGDGALLYLHLLKNGGVLDEGRAARELRLSVRAIQAAAARLTRMGLLSADLPEPSSSGELPEYEAMDVVRRSQSDPEFLALVEETQATLGRVLSSPDVKRLFGIYDTLALPVDVIMLLIHHCKEEHEQRYGPAKNLGFPVIEREAYSWCNREIVTYEQAEAWLTELARRKSLAGEVQRAIGIKNRELSPTERKYIDSWIELGFGPEALALAADRTVVNTGELKWRYMNSIVQSWDTKGLHTVDEIEQGDRKPGARRQEIAAETPSAKELERLRRLREKIKNGEM